MDMEKTPLLSSESRQGTTRRDCSRRPEESGKHTISGILQLLLLIFVWSCLLAGRWLATVDLYGHENCKTERGTWMCYCSHMNDSWSCPENQYQLSSKYDRGYLWEITHSQSDNSTGADANSQGKRFQLYYAYSTCQQAFLAAVAVVLIGIRIYEICREKRKDEYDHALSVVRSKSTSDELMLQWKIAGMFLLGCFIHRMVILFQLFNCASPTEGGLRKTNAVFELTFVSTSNLLLLFEVAVGMKGRSFTMPRKMRFGCGLLGLCSLSLIVDTLVRSTCMDKANTSDLLSDQIWTFLKPLFTAVTIGMYAQCFTLFLHIALQREIAKNTEEHAHDMEEGDGGNKYGNGDTSGEEGRSKIRGVHPLNEQPEGSSEDEWEFGFQLVDAEHIGESLEQSYPMVHRRTTNSQKTRNAIQKDFMRMICVYVVCTRVLPGLLILLPAIVFTLTALFVFIGEEGLFQHLPRLQNTLHVAIVAISLFLLVFHFCIRRSYRVQRVSRSRSTRGQSGNVCVAVRSMWNWLFHGDPERVVYVFYFLLGGIGYNLFEFSAYCKYGSNLHDETRQQMGATEGLLGILSSSLVFFVILKLKLVKTHVDVDVHHSSNNDERNNVITNILKENFDKDKEVFLEDSRRLYIYYDILRPIVVDFRAHTALMLFCLALDDSSDRQVRKRNLSLVKNQSQRKNTSGSDEFGTGNSILPVLTSEKGDVFHAIPKCHHCDAKRSMDSPHSKRNPFVSTMATTGDAHEISVATSAAPEVSSTPQKSRTKKKAKGLYSVEHNNKRASQPAKPLKISVSGHSQTSLPGRYHQHPGIRKKHMHQGTKTNS
ncbi:uncharacterized protein LOC134195044 isoform X2 [Corticium candelabrum]|uniref:uncharacterized protein LOC134195044 isoform X2 n=1 Tax=Corticium candelabrum TaxID=121492 RepID=UPI002E275860|nr:uncharacterized protein LOC134195044 isoform X2 [Corticium candelabrum]